MNISLSGARILRRIASRFGFALRQARRTLGYRYSNFCKRDAFLALLGSATTVAPWCVDTADITVPLVAAHYLEQASPAVAAQSLVSKAVGQHVRSPSDAYRNARRLVSPAAAEGVR